MERDIYLVMAKTADRHWWYVSRRAIVRTVLTRLNLPKATKILEVGCGPGGELAMLSEFGTIAALEPSDLALEIARSRGFADIRKGSLPHEVPFEDGSIDVAVCVDVIEHIEDDLAGLRAINRVLRPHGWFLMTVPAFPFLFDHHDAARHHFRRYRRAPLRALLRTAGFEPVFVGYLNFFLFPMIVLKRLFDKIGKGSKNYDELPAPWANRLLASVFGSERHLIQRIPLPFGVSLIALARSAPDRRTATSPR